MKSCSIQKKAVDCITAGGGVVVWKSNNIKFAGLEQKFRLLRSTPISFFSPPILFNCKILLLPFLSCRGIRRERKTKCGTLPKKRSNDPRKKGKKKRRVVAFSFSPCPDFLLPQKKRGHLSNLSRSEAPSCADGGMHDGLELQPNSSIPLHLAGCYGEFTSYHAVLCHASINLVVMVVGATDRA